MLIKSVGHIKVQPRSPRAWAAPLARSGYDGTIVVQMREPWWSSGEIQAGMDAQILAKTQRTEEGTALAHTEVSRWLRLAYARAHFVSRHRGEARRRPEAHRWQRLRSDWAPGADPGARLGGHLARGSPERAGGGRRYAH